MNKQGPHKIDWTHYTWNPISGCKHNCDYCYMLRMEKRFPGLMEPKYHPNRLMQPLGVKKPSLIFTGSSGDMWGDWVEHEKIDNILNVCRSSASQHTYQFLTKNPKRYGEFNIPKNCWVGTTVDGTHRTHNNDLFLYQNTDLDKVRFISFEPLILPIGHIEWDCIDWIIIGANSNKGAQKPPLQWADELINAATIRGIPVWVKDNYGYPETIKERPQFRS